MASHVTRYAEPSEVSDNDDLAMVDDLPCGQPQRGTPADAVAVEKKEAMCARVVSVQGAISALCLLAILAVGITPSTILTTLVDDSLADTRNSYDASIQTLGNVSRTSLNDVSSFLLAYSAGAVEKAILSFLGQGFDAAVETCTWLEDVEPTLRKDDPRYINFVAEKMWVLAVKLGRLQAAGIPTPILAVGIYQGGLGFAMSITRYPNSPYTFETYNSSTVMGIAERITGRARRARPYPVAMNEIISVKAARDGLLGLGELKYSQLDTVGGSLMYPITMRIADPAQTTGPNAQLEGSTYVSLRNIARFLLDLGDFNSTSGIANPRIFCVIRSSWVAEAYRMQNRSDWQEYDQTGFLTGASAGDSMSRASRLNPVTGNPEVVSVPRKAVNATDPIIQAIAMQLDGHYETFAARGVTAIQADINGTDEVLYTGVYHLNRPDWGLDWWLVVALDQATVLQRVEETFAETDENIKAESARVQDSVDDRKMQSLLITAGVALLILGLSIFLSTVILAPIKHVQHAMSRVASMDLSHTRVEPNSVFFEARQMQRDFAAMVDCLEEYKAYVPASLLSASESSGTMPGGVGVVKVQPPTGNIAIVFTDIQGSTNLWKRSAEDMNVALEKHNELVRAACARHGGYEVKTIGDSFMISLQSPVAAAQLALDIQKAFAEEEWPERLELPGAGMVVRIGVNYGSTISESNPVTGRVDYRGSTVNMASRLEGKAMPGTTCISSDMYAALKPALAELGGPYFQDHGAHELKGLGEGHKLHLMVPASMRHRLVAATSDCNDTATTKRSSEGSEDGRSHRSSNESNMQDNRRTMAKAVTNIAHRTGLQVNRTYLTVAVCRLIHDDCSDATHFDNSNVMVRAASETAASTEGMLGTVAGNMLTVLWNASKKCRMHTLAGLSFAAQVRTRTERFMRVGVATGSTLHGNVGTQKNRFTVTSGVAVDAAEAMADYAFGMGTFCLFADCLGHRKAVDISLEASVRLIDLWHAVSEKKVLRLYELDTKKLISKLGMWEDDDPAETARSHEQTECITQYCKDGDRAMLDRLVALAATHKDTLLQNVVDILSQTTPVAGARCVVNFSHIPAAALNVALPQHKRGKRNTPLQTRQPLPETKRSHLAPPVALPAVVQAYDS